MKRSILKKCTALTIALSAVALVTGCGTSVVGQTSEQAKSIEKLKNRDARSFRGSKICVTNTASNQADPRIWALVREPIPGADVAPGEPGESGQLVVGQERCYAGYNAHWDTHNAVADIVVYVFTGDRDGGQPYETITLAAHNSWVEWSCLELTAPGTITRECETTDVTILAAGKTIHIKGETLGSQDSDYVVWNIAIADS